MNRRARPLPRPGVRAAHAPPDGRRAFSILELALVLCALAVVAVLSIGAFFSRDVVTLENAARLLASDLRAAGSDAAILHESVLVVFHSDGGGYHVQHGGDDSPFAPRRFPRDGVFEDVRVAGVRFAASAGLEFDASGRPTTDAAITLEQRGVTRTVLVEAATGWIRVEGQR